MLSSGFIHRRIVITAVGMLMSFYIIGKLSLGAASVRVYLGQSQPSSRSLGEDRFSETASLTGAIINRDGIHLELDTKIKVSLIHTYSPYTEQRFREMMIDPNKDQHRIFANSPAILETAGRGVLTVMRIWLEKEIWGLTKSHPTNTFSDNYFYIQSFDNHMKPIDEGSILGIPTPIQWTIGDGPIEPRIFRVNDTIYLTFNTGVFIGDQKPIDSTFFWNLNSSKALIPFISGGHPMLVNKDNGMPRDKHWSALVNGTKLYFTYNLDPLRVIDCHLQNIAACHFVHKEGPEDWKFIDARDALRGGTPFVEYKYPYYISIAHGTFFKKCTASQTSCDYMRFYSTHVIVMTIEPVFKVVYVSGDISYPKDSLRVPIVRYRYIQDSFFFPVGLILESADSLIVGGHVNDHSSVLFRLQGISAMMNEVIQYSQEHKLKEGPKLLMLQNYTRQSVERTSGYKFYDF